MKQVLQLLGIVVVVAVAALLFQAVQQRLSDAAFAFTVNPEVLEMLERSLEDQRALANLDPRGEHLYRQRFDELEKTVHRLQILAHNREEMVGRYETILLAVFSAVVLTLVVVAVMRHMRLQPRLARIKESLEGLAEGRTGLEVGVAGRDEVARIATMIEQTSRVMARDRQRLAALKNLSSWQEAARRHAHEMKTPLTAARLEIERVKDLLAEGDPWVDQAVIEATAGALQELDRLARLTRRFTSFARLPRPDLQLEDLGELVRRYVAAFREAWPNLSLQMQVVGEHVVAVDGEMIRQVLANLCDNASRVLGDLNGTVRLSVESDLRVARLEVADDGPGVDRSIRDRLFEPYVTTGPVGESMGLGLAISKKILLEHGGDLELVGSSAKGTTFRLTFNKEMPS